MIPDEAETRVDLGEVRRLITLAMGKVGQLHNSAYPTGQDRPRATAPLQRELLYLEFLLDSARVAVASEYQVLRGLTEHLEDD